MEDLLGLLVFLGFAAVSLISNLAKKKTATTDPVTGKSSGGTSLKDLLSTLQEELQGKPEPTEKTKQKGNKKKQTKKAVKDLEFPKNHIEVTSANSMEEYDGHSTGLALTREQLRQAIIWKEILDPPISLR